MPIKANIITLIQSLLSGNGSVTTWDDHEDILFDNADGILSELYKTSPISDNQGTTTVFTISGSNKNYTFSIEKQGGKVTINGVFFQTGATIYGSDTAWATITNSEYEPTVNTYFCGYGTVTGNPVRMSLFDNGGTWEIRTVDAVAPFETVNFNITYFVGA